MITQMALAEARTQAAAGAKTIYRIEVTLASGATLLVAEATDFEYAKQLGMRVIDEAEAGGTAPFGDATIDGRQVVSSTFSVATAHELPVNAVRELISAVRKDAGRSCA